MAFGFWDSQKVEERLNEKLRLATRNGELDEMTVLLKNGANPNFGLYEAALYDNVVPMAILIDRGACLNMIIREPSFTPLAVALDLERITLAEFIMSKGGRLDGTGKDAISTTKGWEAFIRLGGSTQYSRRQAEQFIKEIEIEKERKRRRSEIDPLLAKLKNNYNIPEIGATLDKIDALLKRLKSREQERSQVNDLSVKLAALARFHTRNTSDAELKAMLNKVCKYNDMNFEAKAAELGLPLKHRNAETEQAVMELVRQDNEIKAAQERIRQVNERKERERQEALLRNTSIATQGGDNQRKKHWWSRGDSSDSASTDHSYNRYCKCGACSGSRREEQERQFEELRRRTHQPFGHYCTCDRCYGSGY